MYNARITPGKGSSRSAVRGVSGEACHQFHRLGLLGDECQPGDTAVGPRAVALADARDRAHQRHLVAELVGDGGDGLVLALGEIQLLDALGRTDLRYTATVRGDAREEAS